MPLVIVADYFFMNLDHIMASDHVLLTYLGIFIREKSPTQNSI